MASPRDQIVADIHKLIQLYKPGVKPQRMGDQYLEGPTDYQQEAQSRLTAAIRRYTVAGNSYRDELDNVISREHQPGWRVPHLLGILTALHDDYRAGHMRTVEELVHADLFSDFLDMAQELQAKGFKDPAAVLTGSVLEEHLRKLADKSSVAVTDSEAKPRKAEALNNDLAAVYGKGEQKQVTAWLDLRNDAAHAHYDNYDHARVALMIQGVRDFLIRHPA